MCRFGFHNMAFGRQMRLVGSGSSPVFVHSTGMQLGCPILPRSAAANQVAEGPGDRVGTIGCVGDVNFVDRPAEGRAAAGEMADAQWRCRSLNAARTVADSR